jgi:hypothetical protein
MEYIDIFERNRLCFDQEQFNIVLGYLNSGMRDDIIEIINILTIQKYIFAEQNSITDYNLIKHLLLKKLENLKEKKVLTWEVYSVNKKNIFDEIKCIDDIDKNEYKEFILKEFPLLEYFFKNEITNYNLTTKPIIVEKYDQNEIVIAIKMFLKIIDKFKGPNLKNNKICLTLCIYDFVFRNFNLVIKNVKFAKTTYNKIIEFEEYETLNCIKKFLEDRNLDTECFTKWKSEIKKVLDNEMKN